MGTASPGKAGDAREQIKPELKFKIIERIALGKRNRLNISWMCKQQEYPVQDNIHG